MNGKYLDKAHEIIDGYDDSFAESIIAKLNATGQEKEQLRIAAQQKRRDIVGDKLFVRGSLEYSNKCSNNCAFCGMAENNVLLPRYELTYEEAKQSIQLLSKYNVKQLHIVTGENWDFDLKKMCDVIKYAISQGLSVTIVLGELKPNDYEKLFEAGASRYILKFETSNVERYRDSKGGKDLYERIANLFLLRDIGYKIGTGVISGLPGTSDQDLIKDLFVLKSIQPNMASVSVFSPNENSRFFDQPRGDVQKTLNFVSLMRLYLERAEIITCSSSFGLEGQVEALNAGANLMSYHITPDTVAKEFSMYTYENRIMTEYKHIQECSISGGLTIAEYI